MSLRTTSNEAAPAVDAAAVTPSDTVDIVGGPARGLYVGGAGNVVVVTRAGNAVTFVAVPAGAVLPVDTRRVNATNTSATNIVALF